MSSQEPGSTSGPRVEFYVIEDSAPAARLKLACRIAEKAFLVDQSVLVWHTDLDELKTFDELLWTFSDRSFVPHAVWPAEPSVAEHTPVLIASGALPESHRDVLINLAPDAPAEPGRFDRICEVVGADEDTKRRARLRWRGYADAGLAPTKHDL